MKPSMITRTACIAAAAACGFLTSLPPAVLAAAPGQGSQARPASATKSAQITSRAVAAMRLSTLHTVRDLNRVRVHGIIAIVRLHFHGASDATLEDAADHASDKANARADTGLARLERVRDHALSKLDDFGGTDAQRDRINHAFDNNSERVETVRERTLEAIHRALDRATD